MITLLGDIKSSVQGTYTRGRARRRYASNHHSERELVHLRPKLRKEIGRVSREGVKKEEWLNVEEISSVVVDTAFRLHRDLGPGLPASVYEAVPARMLERRGLRVERQKAAALDFDGIHFDEGLRVDLLVESCLVVELKSVEKLSLVHTKQLLTYLCLLTLPVGLLIDFAAARFKEGVRRVVNQHRDFASSRLRVSQQREAREDAKGSCI